ncbi:DUF5681 domain-containing protein [Pelagibius sp.]|uniref:DUF5681 domain-containing protein n=1 Tax=Pelagibius sp. TaxID=1931238 RepID=UPI003B50748F
MPKRKGSADYEVGYKKPPKHSRFKKGRSGNPRGRPKGSRNFSTDLKATLEQGVRVTEGGKPKTVSTQLATLLRLREKALAGDGRALDRLIDLARLYNNEEMTEAAKLGAGDAAILESFTARQLRRAGIAAQEPEAESGKTEALETDPELDTAPKQKPKDSIADAEDEDAWLR